MIIKAFILTTLLNSDPTMIVVMPPVKVFEGALFNEYDWEWAIEARRRGDKGNKKRRRGGNGLR